MVYAQCIEIDVDQIPLNIGTYIAYHVYNVF